MANGEDDRVGSNVATFARGIVDHEIVEVEGVGDVHVLLDGQGHTASGSRIGARAFYPAKGGAWVPLNPNEPQVSDIHRAAVAHHRALAGQAAA